MNYVKINGISFDSTVAISDIEESFDVVDGKNAGRTEGNGRMIRDVIGSYLGHKITFFNGKSNEDFDALWDYLKQHSVDDSVMLEATDGQTSISYEAYYTHGSRKIRTVSEGVNYWADIEVNFIPIAPQIIP
ncbi:hypothetical protein [Oscillibacter sp.]|uniref:hypothetical protein n=1 Tax=Oscillibacter sp. TaxID=1945593 RepID=UPI00289CDD56|nr:hypothetical protein [Oscillibacter sp.]